MSFSVPAANLAHSCLLPQKDGRQPQALANAIIAFGSNIENIGTLTPAIQLMATKHCGLQVLPQHYGIVHSNLMTAVGTILADQLTPDITAACMQMFPYMHRSVFNWCRPDSSAFRV